LTKETLPSLEQVVGKTRSEEFLSLLLSDEDLAWIQARGARLLELGLDGDQQYAEELARSELFKHRIRNEGYPEI